MARHAHTGSARTAGGPAPRQMGRCPGCGEWNTMVEAVEQTCRSGWQAASGPASEPRRLAEIEREGLERLPLPLAEFSRVLGGGVVPGSLILVGGDPGIGKTTLLLQVAGTMAEATGRPVLYVSGEESARQIKMRADRLAIRNDNLFVVTETNLEAILRPRGAGAAVRRWSWTRSRRSTSEELTSAAGSISQVRQAPRASRAGQGRAGWPCSWWAT